LALLTRSGADLVEGFGEIGHDGVAAAQQVLALSGPSAWDDRVE